jgi:hypothetical protein
LFEKGFCSNDDDEDSDDFLAEDPPKSAKTQQFFAKQPSKSAKTHGFEFEDDSFDVQMSQVDQDFDFNFGGEKSNNKAKKCLQPFLNEGTSNSAKSFITKGASNSGKVQGSNVDVLQPFLNEGTSNSAKNLQKGASNSGKQHGPNDDVFNDDDESFDADVCQMNDSEFQLFTQTEKNDGRKVLTHGHLHRIQSTPKNVTTKTSQHRVTASHYCDDFESDDSFEFGLSQMPVPEDPSGHLSTSQRHLASHTTTSRHENPSSYLVTSERHITSHPIASHPITSHTTTSRHENPSSHLVTSERHITSHPITSHRATASHYRDDFDSDNSFEFGLSQMPEPADPSSQISTSQGHLASHPIASQPIASHNEDPFCTPEKQQKMDSDIQSKTPLLSKKLHSKLNLG